MTSAPRRVRIAARQSHLARLQAYAVGEALRRASPGLELEYLFKESLGDKNLTDPLWKIPERGVFTEDFVQDLLQDKADLVVHSWKDLPTEARQGLELIGTLPRADARDLLLFRPQSLGREKLLLLTSSPRRTFSAQEHLASLLPFPVKSIETKPVRGNVLTRLRKLVDGSEGADGLFMAKAALDRLLSSGEAEFAEARAQLREHLDQLCWMALPLSLFPAAPAQGALAIEAKAGREDLRKLVALVHCEATRISVEQERKRFAAFGGGCHQKIGLTVQDHPRLGQVEFFFGQHKGETMRHILAERSPPLPGESRWPKQAAAALFSREPLAVAMPEGDLFVSRANALPEHWRPKGLVWTAGVESWRRLAARGIWVNGSADGMGESLPEADALAGRPTHWTKLTHDRGRGDGPLKTLATYKLVPNDFELPLVDEYFWMSASAFRRALEIRPEIRQKRHASGPGHSPEMIERVLGRPVAVYINYRHWNNGDPCEGP